MEGDLMLCACCKTARTNHPSDLCINCWTYQQLRCRKAESEHDKWHEVKELFRNLLIGYVNSGDFRPAKWFKEYYDNAWEAAETIIDYAESKRPK